ncbi:MAG: transglycosylase domain-containing protein, partial [Solirubrobacterales bacterium]
ERQWSKDKIMTESLNSIYFGEGAYGIEAAARTYFSSQPEYRGCGEGEGAPTCASQLLPWDAALLAGIISSPAAYSPIANPNDATARRNLVLQKMTEQGSITDEEYTQYSQQPIPHEDDIAPPEENSEAPYFTSWLRQQVVDHYGAGEAFGGGLTITSTLDLDLQREVEGIVSSTLAAIEPTAAVVVLDNETAGVRAMVGGSDYSRAPFNLATQGRRQPGSAFKPFTLVTALSEGHSSGQVFTSAPQRIPFEHPVRKKNGEIETVNEIFKVNNYEDQYLGSASIATATTFSDNSVYAQIGNAVGWKDVSDTAEVMGIETRVPSNPAMVLGGLKHGVTPLEMAHAYNTLAQDGYRTSGSLAASAGGPLAIQKVTEDEDDDGVVDEGEDTVETTDGDAGENRTETDEVLDPAVAAEAKTLLTSVVTSGTGENAATEEPTWGKTGTTDDNGDAWFCGATDEITVCVWVGHANSVTPMETEYAGAPVDGGTFPALIFSDVVAAWEALQASGETGDGPDGATDDDEDATSGGTETVVPEAPVAPAEEAAAPVAGGGGGDGEPESAAPADEGGGASGAPATAPTDGGVSAG